MKRFGLFTVMLLIGCGGSGPSQAEGPKPTLPSGPDESQAASGAGGEALEAAKAGDFNAAKEKADAALAKNPKDAIAHYARGIAAEDGDKDDVVAEKHYRAALEANPKLVGASIFLSAQLIKLKRFEEAAKVARDGIQHDKGTYELHLHLGIALHNLGDHATAAKSFANAVQLHPDDAALRVDYGRELLEAKDNDAAARAFKEAASKAKGDTTLLTEAALGLKDAGDHVACASTLDPVIAAKASAPLYIVRASCRHGAKDLPGARKDLDEAIKLEKPASFRTHGYAAKYAEEAGDKKACRALYLETAKLIAAEKPGTKIEEEAKKGAERCK
jgi:Tfp pilus assembly protein PilF